MTARSMIDRARKDLGLGEPNYLQRKYQARNGSAYSGNFPWCAAAITIWALESGNAAAVNPAGDRAFTVYLAEDYQKQGRWHAGTDANVRDAKPGDIVFFDWGGSNSIGNIDHVGLVEVNLGGGQIRTIEGNAGDRCGRHVRDATYIAGYGRPAYKPSVTPHVDTRTWWSVPLIGAKLRVPYGRPALRRGSSGRQVRLLQDTLNKVRGAHLKVDGSFGALTDSELRSFQHSAHLSADGEYSLGTARALVSLARHKFGN